MFDDWMDQLVLTPDDERARVIDDEGLYVELSNGEYLEKDRLERIPDDESNKPDLSGETVEVPVEVLHAVGFLCALYGDLLDFRYRVQDMEDLEKQIDEFIYHFPIVQGLGEQQLMDAIGELDWDGKKAGAGMKYLEANPDSLESDRTE